MDNKRKDNTNITDCNSQGNTGILMGMFLVSFVVVVALVTVLSGIGVCERCSIGSGGVYSMISTVLGGQVGGTIGFLYIFGQCVAGAMYITGFAESISNLLGFSSTWAVRGISLAVLLGLLGINLAGVKWIIRLQLLLLFLLAVSTLDFVIGSFTHLDPVFFKKSRQDENIQNMALLDIRKNLCLTTRYQTTVRGSLSSPFLEYFSQLLQVLYILLPDALLPKLHYRGEHTWFLYIVFVFLLGAICTRESLRYDFMIAEKSWAAGERRLLQRSASGSTEVRVAIPSRANFTSALLPSDCYLRAEYGA
ncbi:Solute carrier family 12 member 8 [Chelonia mydas]|uniref:Solute carrier family 12 member 8 n=1 Tax=Chelonia mydas TaxID=8469 RepID=M7BRK4_CHEMY|nr:Solute carrier family 12 member 8 [Chelonia mydas]